MSITFEDFSLIKVLIICEILFKVDNSFEILDGATQLFTLLNCCPGDEITSGNHNR